MKIATSQRKVLGVTMIACIPFAMILIGFSCWSHSKIEPAKISATALDTANVHDTLGIYRTLGSCENSPIFLKVIVLGDSTVARMKASYDGNFSIIQPPRVNITYNAIGNTVKQFRDRTAQINSIVFEMVTIADASKTKYHDIPLVPWQ
jgi:hypothetical protein